MLADNTRRLTTKKKGGGGSKIGKSYITHTKCNMLEVGLPYGPKKGRISQ